MSESNNWSNIQCIYKYGEPPEEFSFILGEFQGTKTFGMRWTRYCFKEPMVLPNEYAKILFPELLNRMTDSKENKASDLLEAIKFLEQIKE